MVNLGELIYPQICLMLTVEVSPLEILETSDQDLVVTQEDIDLLGEVVLEVLETPGGHQDQEGTDLRIMFLCHIVLYHKQVEIINIQWQLQEGRVRLDPDLAPLLE